MLSVKSVSGTVFTRNKLWKSTTPCAPGGTFLAFCSQQIQTNDDLIDKELKFKVDEEEVEKKRLKANLPNQVYRQFIKKEFLPPTEKQQFRKKYLRKLYGRYGEQSGLNPGIAWPTREELLEIIDHDKMFHPSLREMLDNVAAVEQAKLQERLEYEAEVDKNMEKVETYKKEYYAKIAKKKAAAEASKLKQQKLVEEISELLGYDVSPKDPKFEEAVEMKRKEEKKAQKEKKQQESYERMLAKLANIAASSKKAAAASESQSEGASKEKHDEKPK